MTTMTTMLRPPLPVSALDLLARAHRGLLEAELARTSEDRYVAAHLAALRAAAAVLAVRGRPSRRGPTNVWDVLPRVAPELAEWAAFFAAGASRRASIEAGRTDAVSAREADDLMRDGHTFVGLVTDILGIGRPML